MKRVLVLIAVAATGLALVPAVAAAPPTTTVLLVTDSQDKVLDQGKVIIRVESNQPEKVRVKGNLRPGSVDAKYRFGPKTKTVDEAGTDVGFKLNRTEIEAVAAAASTCTTSRVTFVVAPVDSPSGASVTVRAKLERRSDC